MRRPASFRAVPRSREGAVRRGVKEGLPRTVVRVLVAAFALSLAGLLSWFAYFVLSAPGAAVDRVGVGPGLWLTAGLAAGVALTSGLLVFHHGREAYGGDGEVLFRSCLIVSTGVLLCSGIYACAIRVLG